MGSCKTGKPFWGLKRKDGLFNLSKNKDLNLSE